MATSSQFATSNTYIKYWFEVIQTSQSISGNYSTVTVKVWAKRTNTGYTTWGSGSVSCVVNGKSYSYSGSYTITSSAVCLKSITGIQVNHDSDGKKSLTVSGSIAIPDAGLTSSSHSFTTSLTTIPRTSSISLSASSVAAGSAITVTITRASSSFTHNVGFYFGNHVVSVGTKVGTSISYTIPLAYLDAIPSSTSGSAKIVVDTYSGSTRIGTTSKTFTITAPSSVVPSFSSLSITRVDNGVPSAWGMYVKGKSKATLTINGSTGIYGSSISKYSISGGGYSTTASSFTTGVLNTVGTNTFTATITDSRGRTATKTVTCSVVDYFTPRISYTEAFRCNSSGVADENGTYIKVKANFSYASLSGKNGFESNVSYAKSNTSTYSTPISITNDTYSSTIGGGAISVDSSYSVKFRVADYFTSHEVYATIPTPSVTMDFKKGGKGVAIGKVSETDNLFEVAWLSKFLNGLHAYNTTNPITFYAGADSADNSFYRLCNKSGIMKVNFTTGEAGEAMRLHAYSNGTWKSYIKFYENGVIQSNGLTCYGSLITNGSVCKVCNPSGGDCYIEFNRGSNADWRIVNSAGNLYLQSNYTTSKGGYYNVLQLNYNSGSAILKGGLSASGDVNISGGYLKVGGKNFRGWGFSSGNVYYLGLSGDDKYVRMYNGDITVANGVSYLGSPSGRFIKLYCSQAVDVSSDLRKKDNVLPYDAQLETFYDLLNPISYTLKQGHSGRRHLGFIAQEVEQAMTEVGMEYKDLSFLQKAPLDESGNEIDPTTITDYKTDERIKDYEYSLAYTELIALNTHMIQKLKEENKKLTDEVNFLKNEINEIKTKLGLS